PTSRVRYGGRVRRIAVIGTFIAALLTVHVGGHLYLAEQLVLASGLPAPWRGAALLVIGLGGASLVLQPLGARVLSARAARCNALRPDLVAITGDLVDGDVAHIGDEVAPLAALRAAHGVYFVTGNHDYYSGADAWVARVEELGIRALRNQRVTIGGGDGAFDLAGVEDHHAHLVSATHREDLAAALAGRDPQRPI